MIVRMFIYKKTARDRAVVVPRRDISKLPPGPSDGPPCNVCSDVAHRDSIPQDVERASLLFHPTYDPRRVSGRSVETGDIEPSEGNIVDVDIAGHIDRIDRPG